MNDEESWCSGSGSEAIVSKESKPNSKKSSTLDQKSQEQPTFANVIRAIFYGEQREPTEDTSQRDVTPDKIEAYRWFMDGPREMVTQNHCTVETRGQNSMLKFANQTLDETEIIKRYLGPGAEINNSAMLFLAGTLFSSNQYLFELLNEGGFFTPSSQNLVNSLASDFINQSKQLSSILLKAERSSGASINNAVVSRVNNFVSTSNKLSKALLQECNKKAAAAGSAKEVLLNNIIAKRDQISNSLYDFFQRTVAVEKSNVLASASKAASISKEVGDTVCFRADAEKFTTFLYEGVNTDGFACGNEVDSIRKVCSSQSDEKYTTDTSDIMSTASSFLDFVNMSSLSAMFDEEELSTKNADVAEEHLDAIFERINLSLPKKKRNGNTFTQTNKMPAPKRLTAREKRRQMIIARGQEREEKKKQKRLGKKKAIAEDPNKNSTGRKSKKSLAI